MMNFKTLILSGLFLSTIQFASAQPCTSPFKPVILVHGFLGSGDNYGPLVRQLSEAGYCTDRFFAYDWNSLARTDQNTALDKFIDSVLALTGAKQADLIGHSAGGGIGYAYLSDSIRATKIAHYIHIGSGAQK
jgi:pimeloyl-ACP methyl ester carboxylesterase